MAHNYTLDPTYTLQARKLTAYRRDVVVAYTGLTNNRPNGDHKRQAVTEFSDDARRRLAFVAANTSVNFQTMITLTYPNCFPGNGKLVKKHLRAFLMRLRRNYDKPDYLWFLEFQKRGAPHFHVLITTRYTPAMKSYISQAWYEIVGSEDAKHRKAGTRVEAVRSKDGATRYALKYAAKMRQKEVPGDYQNVGRFYGYSTPVKPEPIADPIMLGDHDLIHLYLAEWKYAGKLKWRPLSVLYGATDPLFVKLHIDKTQTKR